MPHTLNRPPLNWVEPRKTAVRAGSSRLTPTVGSPAFSRDAMSTPAIAAIPEIVELNIGHFLVGEAVFTGLAPAVKKMKNLMMKARQ